MKDKLVTPSYCFIMAANFLLFFGFWLLIPVLPFYLKDSFACSDSIIGLVLSCYIISSLCIRPFSGYLYDGLSRKPLYILSYFIFTSVFLGYYLAATLSVFIICRAVHGLAFGTVTVGGNTIVIDITPSSRRGEAVGYYGLMNNIAMSSGPMVGIYMHEKGVDYSVIFLSALISCVLGLIAASFVKTSYKKPEKRPPVSLDRFILLKGIPASISLLLLSIPYGCTTNYVAMYVKQIGLDVSSAFFFVLMAIGMGISRLFAGRWVNRGLITETISRGFYLIIAAFFLLGLCRELMEWQKDVADIVFLLVPLMQGVGFGIMFPAYNTLYVNLAPNNRRGTATSTYLTAWDVGIGIGMVTGGCIADWLSFSSVYFLGTVLSIISMVYFNRIVTPHFKLNKVR